MCGRYGEGRPFANCYDDPGETYRTEDLEGTVESSGGWSLGCSREERK